MTGMLANRFGAKADNLNDLTLNGEPIELKPASLEAARQERERLVLDIQEIDSQLTDQRILMHAASRDDYEDWKRRSRSAKTLKVLRLRFLKRWLADHYVHVAPTPANLSPNSDIPMGTTLRMFAKRSGQLEAVYYAAVLFFEEESPEAWEHLQTAVETAVELIGGVPDEIAAKIREAAA